MFWKVCRICLKTLLFAVLLVTLAVAAFIIRLKTAPLVLNDHLNIIEPYLKLGRAQMKTRHLELYFDGGLRLLGRDVHVVMPDGGVNVRAKSVHLALSNRNAVVGRFVVKHAIINDLDLTAGISEEGLTVAGVPVRHNDQTGSDVEGSLIDFLNRNHTHPQIVYLRTIQVGNVNLIFQDDIYGQTWQASNANLRFTNYEGYGEELRLSGRVKRVQDEKEAPVVVHFSHQEKAETGRIAISFSESNTDLIRKYMPARLKDYLNASGRVSLVMDIDRLNQLQNQRVAVSLGETSLHIKDVYTNPLQLAELDMVARYTESASDTLTIDRLAVTDMTGLQFSLSGRITGLNTRPHLKATLRAASGTIQQITTILPDKAMAGAVRWLNTDVEGGMMENLVLNFDGYTDKLPHCHKDCGLTLQARHHGATIHLLEGVPPVTDISGTLAIEEDRIMVFTPKARMGNHVGKDISVTVNNLFTSEELDLYATMEGELRGPSQGVVDAIAGNLGREWFPPVAGTHVSQIKTNFPLGKKGFDHVKMNVQTRFTDIGLNVPNMETLRFESATSTMDLTHKRLIYNGAGDLDGVPVVLRWQENMRSPGDKAQATIEGVISSEKLMELAKTPHLMVDGPTAFDLKLKQDKKTYDYELTANLTEAGLGVPTLNWQKDAGKEASLRAGGQVHVKDGSVALDVLTLDAEDAQIVGRFYYNPENSYENVLHLNPLRLGRSHVEVLLEQNSLNISGHALDLTKVDLFGQDAAPPLKDGVIALDVNHVYLEGGPLYDLKGRATRVDGLWGDSRIDGRYGVAGDKNLTLAFFREGREDILDIIADDAGTVLKTFGLYENLNDGKAHVRLAFDPTKIKVGKGRALISDVQLTNAPILVRLLSALSLTELLSNKEGISFDKVRVPMEIEGNVVKLDEVVFTGPTIGLRFGGLLDTQQEQMDLRGQLIPVEGLNTIVDKIPLVGSIITGSQDGVLVADYSIDGSFEDPDVSVNPFSVVTPGLLKDIFGVLIKDKPKLPSQNKPN